MERIYTVDIYRYDYKTYKTKKYNFMQKHNKLDYPNKLKTKILNNKSTCYYDKILGKVEILFDGTDILFKVYKSVKTGRRFIDACYFYQNYETNGLHFGIYNLSNEEIVSQIIDFLKIILKNSFDEDNIIDFELLKIILPSIILNRIN